MRVLKVKGFARYQRRERISDEALAAAVLNAELGLIGADLGGGLIKQRVARSGQGKSGGYRTIIAYRRAETSIFLLGFARGDRANIGDDELDILRSEAKRLLSMRREQFDELILDDELTEVEYDHDG